MTHVRNSLFYPQSNGKIERWHQSLKRECIRPLTPFTLEDARRLIQIYVDHYNTVRLHSAIGYVTPQDMLAETTGGRTFLGGRKDVTSLPKVSKLVWGKLGVNVRMCSFFANIDSARHLKRARYAFLRLTDAIAAKTRQF
jgi:hypothetical protein